MIDHDNLEEFADATNYDWEDQSDTGIAFYTALAQESGGPVLEIACGTGRVCIPMARQGFAVTGLDVVPGMLAQARSKFVELDVCWVEVDARMFDLDEKQFRLIFLTGNAFQAFLTNADQDALPCAIPFSPRVGGAAALQRIRHHAAVRRLDTGTVDGGQPEHHFGLPEAGVMGNRRRNRSQSACTSVISENVKMGSRHLTYSGLAPRPFK